MSELPDRLSPARRNLLLPLFVLGLITVGGIGLLAVALYQPPAPKPLPVVRQFQPTPVAASPTANQAQVPAPATETIAPGTLLFPVPPTTGEGIVPGLTALDFTAKDLKGQPVQLSSYRGKNAVWLTFWAEWCVQCWREMPQMEQLYQQYKDKGLTIIGFNFDDNAYDVKKWVAPRDFHWLFVVEPSQQTVRQYNVLYLPVHIFIDKAGVIQSRSTGELMRPEMEYELTKIMDPPQSLGSQTVP